MPSYQDLSEFERGVIVGAREMVHSISERTVQAGGGSVMVWGVSVWLDMEPLMCLDTALTVYRYVSILSDHLKPFMSIVHSHGLGDNATPHTSRIATE
ncbi:uncharacterized protein TNCV_1525411 [Trichonephila clavipes]|nr:uncharacterized protein TNCV_1525411 [Trichonephila clavipes]